MKVKSMLSNRSKSNHSDQQDCEQKLQCAACLVAFDKKYWSKAERDHYERDRRTLLVCKSCRDSRGYTPDDVKTYTCQHCHDKGGWKLFDQNLMENYKYHRRQRLLCKLCVLQLARKTDELRQKFKNSKRFCKCFCPIHRQSCPLSPCYFNERRWPGSDGCITEDEKDFLENLNPTPSWWQKAWGRRQ